MWPTVQIETFLSKSSQDLIPPLQVPRDTASSFTHVNDEVNCGWPTFSNFHNALCKQQSGSVWRKFNGQEHRINLFLLFLVGWFCNKKVKLMLLQAKTVSQRANSAIAMRLCESRALSKLLALTFKEKVEVNKRENDELINTTVGTEGMEKN